MFTIPTGDTTAIAHDDTGNLIVHNRQGHLIIYDQSSKEIYSFNDPSPILPQTLGEITAHKDSILIKTQPIQRTGFGNEIHYKFYRKENHWIEYPLHDNIPYELLPNGDVCTIFDPGPEFVDLYNPQDLKWCFAIQSHYTSTQFPLFSPSPNHQLPIFRVDKPPEGDLFAIYSTSGGFRFDTFKPSTTFTVFTLKPPLRILNCNPQSLTLIYPYLYYTDQDIPKFSSTRSFCQYNLITQELHRKHTPATLDVFTAQRIRHNPNHQFFLIGRNLNQLPIYTADLKLYRVLKLPSLVRGASFSPDGLTLAVATRTGTVILDMD